MAFIEQYIGSRPAQAEQVLDYYTQRWFIERFFYVLKKGFLKVEDLQIENAQSLQNAIVLKCYQALSLMKLQKMVLEEPEKALSASEFEQEDYEIAFAYVKENHYKKVVYQAEPSIFDFALLLDMMAGEKTSSKKLGLIRLSRGYEKFEVIKKAYLTFQKKTTDRDVGNG